MALISVSNWDGSSHLKFTALLKVRRASLHNANESSTGYLGIPPHTEDAYSNTENTISVVTRKSKHYRKVHVNRIILALGLVKLRRLLDSMHIVELI